MSEVKRYDAVHIRYEESNIRYGEGCEVEMVMASDYDKLAAELVREKIRRRAIDDEAFNYSEQVEELKAELAELKAKMEGMVLVPVELIEHVKHARKLLGGNGAPEWQREKLRQKLTDLLAKAAPAEQFIDHGCSYGE